MKYIIVLFVFASSCLIHKRITTKNNYARFDLNSAIKETKEIMNQLSIKTRANIKLDDSLKIHVNRNETFLNAKFGSATPEKGVMSPQDHIELRYYVLPLIKISPIMDSIIFNKKDTSQLIFLKATSIVIHEISHYLQETWDDNYFEPQTISDEKKYISQPTEIEAHAVGSYYFLNLYKPLELQEIMSSKETLHRKYELLINAYRKYIYPWRPVLF